LFFVLTASFALVGRLFSESETVLAKFGDTVITQKDLDEFMTRFAYARKNKPYSSEEKKEMLNNMVKGTLVCMEAEKEKLDQDPTVRAKLRNYRNELLIQEYLAKKITPHITIKPEEVDQILKDHPNLLPKETLTMKEILVSTEKEALAIRKELSKGGDFSKIAMEKSKAESRINGGTMRPVSRGQFQKEIEEVIFSLKRGEVSKPVKGDRGYYIFLLVDRREKSPEEMEKLQNTVREKIQQLEITKRGQEALEKKAEELRKKEKVEVFYDRIQ